ncbi:MAG: murein biosynthesis integral membrane protein MurJ [Desulfobacterota bacterium]|nr:murein biosynthesis integral membrane protein MurJ [Thermodesulfobacteriota bacterium]
MEFARTREKSRAKDTLMSEHGRITKAASIIGMGTLLSRILGFLRDVVIAHFFGAGMAADAFFVAFRIPNLWRRLVGEGSLTVSFIPIYTEYLHQRPEREAKEVAHIAFTLLGLGLLMITILGILFSPLLIRAIAPGFIEVPEKFELTVTLTRIVFPYLFFMGLFALCMGLLNAHRHFLAPALAPIFLNISIILCVLLFFSFFRQPVMTLAFGVLAGGVIQFLFQIPFLWKKGIGFHWNFNFRHPAIQRIGRMMVPGVIGTAVYQLNVFVDTIFASFLPGGSVSYLFFADRLLEFPLGLFAIAIGMASLPSLSGLLSQGRWDEFKHSLWFTFHLTAFVSIPAMVGLIALKTPIVNLLFQRGLFDNLATQMTAKALLCYAIGLWAIAGVRTIVPAFYALKDAWSPLKIAILCLVANALLNSLFLFLTPLGHAGLALATSLSSMLNLFLLALRLRQRLPGIDIGKSLKHLLRNLLCSLPMGWVAYLICSLRGWNASGETVQKAILLSGAMVGGVGIYLLLAYLLKNEELSFLIEILRKRRLKKKTL